MMQHISTALLAWYDAQRRDLPWRGTSDAYAIWVSEIMLQQTRVAAVIGYYSRFIGRFPDVRSLAAADESDVLACWSGLGYYRRARMMHAAAKKIVTEFRSEFPRDSAALRELPGIGRYTAAAIASIAFAEPIAVVDGNVERVLSRMAGDALTQSDCWEGAQRLIPHDRPGDFNQAMMELGATVCTPRSPQCLLCPVRAECRTQGEFETVRQPERKRAVVHFALRQKRANGEQHVLLRQRDASERKMASMWELPAATHAPDPLYTFKHSITDTDYTVHVHESAARRRSAGAQWIAASRLCEIPLTGVARKALKRANILSS